MIHDWWVILSPIFGLVVNIIIQILSHRLILWLTLLRSVFFGFGVGFSLVITFEIQRYSQNYYGQIGDFWGILIVNSVTYAFLGYCYFSLIGLGETARRIRLLKDLYAVPNEGLSLSEILSEYSAKNMVDKRLDRLLNNGQVRVAEGRYYINKPVMLFFTKFSIFMKLLVLGKRSEFD
jgi:hypothetical protein